MVLDWYGKNFVLKKGADLLKCQHRCNMERSLRLSEVALVNFNRLQELEA
jgi:hypothetical protein